MLDRLLISSSARAIDPNFRNVTLLLHGDGSNGAQNNTFLDSSSNNFTVTRNGNTTQGSFSPYGTRWSNYFDGSGDFLSAPSNAVFDLGGGNFTIECWFNANSFAANAALISRYTYTSSGFGWIIQTRGPNTIRFVWGNDNIFDCTVPTMSAGTWYHVAGVRVGNTVTIYLNGVQVGQNTGVTNFSDASSTTLQIGRTHTITDDFPGYISNVRVVKGTAVYTSNFTPPTAPLTAISGTSILTCQSNRFRDASTNNFAITRNGDVRVSPFSPYAPSSAYSAAANGGSMYFDGTGDYLTVPYTTANFDWYTSGTDFTIEAWFYANTLTNTSYPNGGVQAPVLCGNRDPGGGTDYWSFGPTSEGIVAFYYFSGSAQRVTSTTTVSAGVWTHIAMTKTSSGITLFVNGTAQTTTAISGSPQSSSSFPFAVGQGGSSSYSFPGYISGLRVVRGTAVYSGNFTPPTAPLTAITNTSLLLNGTNAAIFDSAADNDLETVGNAQISTSVKKFGTGSMAFDGSGDRLLATPSEELNLATGDFTVEGWFYTNSLSGNASGVTRAAAGNITVGTELQWGIYRSGSSMFVRPYQGSTDFSINVGTVATGTWYHVAMTRSGNTIRGFLNGVLAGTTQTISGALNNNTVWFGAIIGGITVTGVDEYWNGYIDDLRITKGVARYTANFTPPAAPFPDQ